MSEVHPDIDFETLIVGAGISGIGLAIEIQKQGLGSYQILEKAQDLGGTWRDNTYPGVAVDIPSIAYSFSYENDYPWSRHFAPGAEIHDYLHGVADKYGVKPHIRYGAQVLRAVFDEETRVWTTELSDGTTLRSRFLVGCTGILSIPKFPQIEGLDSFAGTSMHTARWDHDVSLEGKRVGLIGTGASAVQIIPSIAPEVGKLSVFQRTPVWVGPRQDAPIDPPRVGPFLNRVVRRLRRYATEAFLQLASWGSVNLPRSQGMLERAQAAQEAYIRRSIEDESLHEKLIPEYAFGCKRPTFSNTYLQAFNRDNVALVTDSIERITKEGIVTADGAVHELDVLVLATGFKTMELGNGPAFDVHGLEGRELGKWWHENRYQAFGGVSIPRFPNFFLTAGPYAGGLNWFDMLEPHVYYICRCIKQARKSGANWIEVKQDAHDAYMDDMRRRSLDAAYSSPNCAGSNSYYIDHHGDASLGYPRTPWFRWFRVRFRSLADFRLAPEGK